MPDPEHLRRLQQGVESWNAWRHEYPRARPDLTGAILDRANLGRAQLAGAKLHRAELSGANLSQADLSRADLERARLRGATLVQADLRGADFSGADLTGADLSGAVAAGVRMFRAILEGANLQKATLEQANLIEGNLARVDLRHADMFRADLFRANLAGANLSEANLTRAYLVETNFEGSDLTGCVVYGASAWGTQIDERTRQGALVISRPDEPVITVDNLEVAQFLYLLLHNQRLRAVIDTVTSKVVLILGRFTEGRKVVLDAIRDELRRRDYLPALFDFAKPAHRDMTETITTLALMSRFIIADISEPRSVPQELYAIVPHLRSVPIQLLLAGGSSGHAMVSDLLVYPWVLGIHHYDDVTSLVTCLPQRIIDPAEARMRELEEKRRVLEQTMFK